MAFLRVVASRCVQPVSTAQDSSIFQTVLGELLEQLRPLFEPTIVLQSLQPDAAAALLRDLAFGIVDLTTGRAARALLATTLDKWAWEIGLERDGSYLLVSLYRTGRRPIVSQADRAVSCPKARACIARGIATFNAWLDDGTRSMPHARQALCLAQDQLQYAAAITEQAPLPRAALAVQSKPNSVPLFSTECVVRKRALGSCNVPELARADLSTLLFCGTVQVRLKDATLSLPEAYVFLFADQLLSLTSDALTAYLQKRSMLCRVRVGRLLCGVGLDGGRVTLVFEGSSGNQHARKLPPVPIEAFVHSVLSFARSLVKQLRVIDRSQRSNLKLTALDSSISRLNERIAHRRKEDCQLNQAPESYRAFATGDDEPKPRERASGAVTRLRFSEVWRALVPGMDLKAVFLLGDRLLVGSMREIACLSREEGILVWRAPVRRGISILTPRGVARLSPDGWLALYDFDSGDNLFELKLQPCVGATASGAVVHAPGLPPMAVLGEGAGHLAAIELETGQVRWRRTVQRRGVLRLKRAGKLMVVAGGSSELLGLDMLSGEVVWRHRAPDGGVYGGAICVERGEVFALGTPEEDSQKTSFVTHIDPWSGRVRWSTKLPRPVHVAAAPLLCSDLLQLLTSEPTSHGAGLVGLERQSGQIRYSLPDVLGRGATGCIALDDIVIANSETGSLVAVDSADGSTRYRHDIRSGNGHFDAYDRPQCYKPVLRSGALFVPQSEVLVVRPHDGAVVGRLPDDLIPDLLRVDERCGVYVAEMSGHLAAYEALPSLTLLNAVPNPK